MNNTTQKRYVPIAIAITLIAFGGLSIWYWGPPTSVGITAKDLNQDRKDSELPGMAVLQSSTQDQLVSRYVTAYQTRNCSEVAKCTLWVQDRLSNINEDTVDSAIREDERSSLCAQLFSRDAGLNRLSILGIDDQYLIPVTSTFTIEGADAGRRDLDVPVLERVWVIFTYNDPGTAPRDEQGETIHSVRAGVNISMNHLVLKGSVRGNWEIDFDSISLQW